MLADNRFDALGEISLSEDGSTDQEQCDMNEANESDRNDGRPGSRAEEDPLINCPHFHFAPETWELHFLTIIQRKVPLIIDVGGVHNCDYAMSGDKGMPHWTALFRYLLMHFEHVRWLSTLFVLVDNRDLTESSTPQETLSRWPTVEAWWKSRLTMYGPAEELCDLLFVPIGQATGLHNVHPTWAGTFVFALTFLFPGVHLVTLDSGCVPVTLFEVADLWKEVSYLRNRPTERPVSAAQGSVEGHQNTVESAPKTPKLGGRDLKRTEIGHGHRTQC